MLDKSTLQFLKNLKQNNNKDWFEANRKKYDAARENFLMLVEEVLKGLTKNDERFSTLTAKSCL